MGGLVVAGKENKIFRKFDLKNDQLNYTFTYNDEETKALHERLNGASTITIDDLRRVSLWKSGRVMSVSEETLKKLVELSKNKNVKIDDALVKDVLERLVLSQGIGFPMASAILKFINPDVFPIIDVRAYRALTGKKPYYGTYSYNKYIEYVNDLAKIARETKRPLREIDEQLYCFDDKHNGKI
jgi:thermostable 8-oxoguanine DNA glycosylase